MSEDREVSNEVIVSLLRRSDWTKILTFAGGFLLWVIIGTIEYTHITDRQVAQTELTEKLLRGMQGTFQEDACQEKLFAVIEDRLHLPPQSCQVLLFPP